MALSKHSQSYVDEMLTCAICLELVKEPRTLQQCFHSFCNPCIKQLTTKQDNPNKGVYCPICNSLSKSEEIKINFFVNDLLDMHQNSLDTNQVRMCEQCSDEGDKIAAKFKCLDCRFNICNGCRSSHLKIPILKGHQIVPLKEETELVVDKLVFCEKHSHKPIEFYCLECEELICITCKVTEHESHKIETVERALERMLKEIDAGKINMEEKLKDIENAMKQTDEKVEETKKCYANCHSLVNEATTAKIADINAIARSLHEQLNQKENEEINRIKDMQKTLTDIQKEKQNLQRVVKARVECARHVSLLNELIVGNLHKKVSNNDEQIIRLSILYPSFNKSIKKLDETLLGSLSYQRSHTNLIGLQRPGRNWLITSQELVTESVVKQKEIPLTDTALRMVLDEEHRVWLTRVNVNIVCCLSTNGSIIKNITIKAPRGIGYLPSGTIIVVSCGSTPSIHCIDSETYETKLLFNGTFTDICTYGNTFCTLDYNKNEICFYEQFKQDKKSFKQLSKIVLTNGGPRFNDRSTILLDSSPKQINTIYVSSFDTQKLYLYNSKGALIQQFSTQYSSYLSGLDENSNIILAQHSAGTFKTLHISDGHLELLPIKDLPQNTAYDIVFGDNQTLWIICLNRLVKYKLG